MKIIAPHKLEKEAECPWPITLIFIGLLVLWGLNALYSYEKSTCLLSYVNGKVIRISNNFGHGYVDIKMYEGIQRFYLSGSQTLGWRAHELFLTGNEAAIGYQQHLFYNEAIDMV